MPPLDIGLLGGFSLSSADGEIARLGSTRAEKLLAYLLLHRALPQSRQQLAYLFWPDSSETQAQTNLRRELHRLRRFPLVSDLLEVQDHSLGLRSDFTLDVERFEAACAEAETRPAGDDRLRWLEEAVRSYHGDLLPELYDEWVREERERLRRRYGRALELLVAEHEARRNYHLALEYARRLTSHDPITESGHLSLMRLHALRGDHAAAVASYRAFEAALEEELGVEPGPQLREAYARYSRSTPDEERSDPGEREPLVGREAEWRALLHSWSRAAAGSARAVVIYGEAGIGKTRLADELCDWVESQRFTRTVAHCYRAEGRLALSPVSEWFREPAVRKAVRELDPVWLSEIGRLLPDLSPESPTGVAQPMSESWRRRQLFESLARAMAATRQPLLLVLDDAQWCDPETLEWLHYLLRFDPSSRLLLVMTVRNEEELDNPELGKLLLELRQLEVLDEISLAPLDEAATSELATRVMGRQLQEEESTRLYEQSAGHPLFVVEMTRAEVQGNRLESSEGSGALDLPPKVHAVITARLVQLTEPAQEVVLLAATIGRPFDLELLQRAGDLEEGKLATAVDELWQRKILVEHGADEYDFSHDRIREVAYAQLGPAQRRLLHRRVAEALESRFADDLGPVSALIAAHYEQAGRPARAIHFFEQAAKAARGVSAISEALRLLNRGLTQLQLLPASPERDRLELALQFSVSAPLNFAYGYASPQVKASLERVRVLGERLGQESMVIRSLVGLVAMQYVRGDNLAAQRLGEEAVARAAKAPGLLPEAHFILCPPLLGLGRFEEVLRHTELSAEASPAEDSSSLVIGSDLAVFRLAYASHALWLLGKPDRARKAFAQAMARARWLEDPYNLALASAYGALLAQFSGEVEEAERLAERTRTVCERYGYAYYREWGAIVSGWARAMQQGDPEAVEAIDRALDHFLSVAALARRPYYLSLKAQALLKCGDFSRAESVLSEALELSASLQDVWWDAELLRLQGELAARTGEPERAEECFRRSIAVAAAQGSNSLRLRAVLSLTRLVGGGELLREAYDSFDEGLDAPDLIAARQMLGSRS